MSDINNYLGQLYLPSHGSHKGQNGKLLLIGGSELFHAASLWALKVASRIVDLVHYASVPENNEIVLKAKSEFRDGIVIARSEIENYIDEDDCILIGCGMERNDETRKLTEKLLKKYPKKKWVIDAGSLQMMEPEWIPGGAILTPHKGEFTGIESRIKNKELRIKIKNLELKDKIKLFAQEYNCVVLLKGEEDIVCNRDQCEIVKGGNAGMTKGGTGDVLAGLVAALYCKNDPFISAVSASYINKKAGDNLFKKMGYFFNASDLTDEIPKVMREKIMLLVSG
ncbi:MAG: NAD(P)H-hydrate dehydratase [Patescibacteria group bacterium]|nr:NAD(P)H-hydrate dehydratase [Patescibacteria group bacterium]